MLRVYTQKHRISVITLILLISTLLLPLANVGIIVVPQSDRAEMEAIFEDLRDNPKFILHPRADIGEESGAFLGFQGEHITFDVALFSRSTQRSRQDALSVFIKALQESSLPTQTEQQILDQLGVLDPTIQTMMLPLIFDSTRANLNSAFRILRPAIAILGDIFGVLAVLIFAFMILTTIIDLLYLVLPYTEATAEADKGGGNQKPWFVSAEVYSALKESYTAIDSGGYKAAILIYFRRRAVMYVIMGVAVTYLVLGQLGSLIGALMGLAEGII